MIIVFSTVDTAEQEVGRAECTEAIGDAYANGAVGREATCAAEYCVTRRVRPTDSIILVGDSDFNM